MTKLSSLSTDNVFAPCDCEDNIEDEEEREVEAFKRLCFHSHAKPRKIKIAAPPVPEALKIRYKIKIIKKITK